MSIAESIVETIRTAQPVQACTLQYGYLISADGSRETFQPGRIVSERRRHDGRCLSMVAEYADGSRIRYAYDPNAYQTGRYGATRAPASRMGLQS